MTSHRTPGRSDPKTLTTFLVRMETCYRLASQSTEAACQGKSFGYTHLNPSGTHECTHS